jgi:hypothetical protein
MKSPNVVALSTYEASVGTSIKAYGSNFAMPSRGESYLVFQGTFEAEDGTTTQVDKAFEVDRDDAGTLVWDRFGPYEVPFGPGDKIGVFEGTVAARTELKRSETVLDDPDPLDVTFRIKPSILVHELQPTPASCAKPIKRAIEGAPYRIKVQAVGFEPQRFSYSLDAPGLQNIEPIRVRHAAKGKFDTLGERNTFRFPKIPDNLKSYTAKVFIQAEDRDGGTYSSVFGIGVHRPLDVFYNGNVEIAEIFAPQPVSSCIRGGINGRQVSYDETQVDSETRTWETNWEEEWLRRHTVSEGTERAIREQRVNSLGFSTSDEQLFRWEMSNEVRGSVGVPKVIGLELAQTETSAGQTREEEERTINRESGLEQEERTTRQEEIEEANSQRRGGSFQRQVTSEERINRDFGGEVIAGTAGVFYRQKVRMIRRAALVTYNACGIAQTIGEIDITDWNWSPDLALGDSCNPLPESNLPPAQCNVPPCSGDQ